MGSNAPRQGHLSPDPLPLRDTVRAGDVVQIRALVTATGFFSPEEIAIAGELAEETLARGPGSGYEFLFADDPDGIIGYTCFGRIPGTRSGYDLYWIAVHPHHQRTGLGRRLLTESEARILRAGGERVYVETSGRERYAPTRSFYQRCGYDVAAVFPDFYAAGDDRIVYIKVLGS